MGIESCRENDAALADYGLGFAVMHHPGSKKSDAGVAVVSVIPGKEVLAKSPDILDGTKAVRKARAILQGYKLRLRKRIIIRNMRSA